VLTIYFETPENSIAYQHDAKNLSIERLTTWNGGSFKNNGCTECDVQYNHYYSNAQGDNAWHKRLFIVHGVFENINST
jgi:hypothetical protein